LDQLRGLPGAKDAEAAWAGAAAGPGYDCDATIVPIVTGHIDPAVLDRLAAALLRGRAAKTGQDSQNGPDSEADAARRRLAERAARQIVIAHAADLMSGPAGLAAYLRTGLLHSPAASVSLPLDAGAATETIPRAPNGPPGHRPGPPLPPRNFPKQLDNLTASDVCAAWSSPGTGTAGSPAALSPRQRASRTTSCRGPRVAGRA